MLLPVGLLLDIMIKDPENMVLGLFLFLKCLEACTLFVILKILCCNKIQIRKIMAYPYKEVGPNGIGVTSLKLSRICPMVSQRIRHIRKGLVIEKSSVKWSTKADSNLPNSFPHMEALKWNEKTKWSHNYILFNLAL